MNIPADLLRMKNSDAIPSGSNACSLTPDSPCVGRCSTAYGDDICKGCGRTFLEVINWIMFDEQQKAEVWARLQKPMAADEMS